MPGIEDFFLLIYDVHKLLNKKKLSIVILVLLQIN